MKIAKWIIIIGLFLLSTAEAFGCSCVAITPSEAFDQAQAVFTGTVIKARKAEWVVSVDRVWKGELKAKIVLRDALARSSCASHFKRGVSYLFLIDVNERREYSPQVCTWTTRLKTIKVRFAGDEPYRFVEDLVLMGRGEGHPPLIRPN